MSTWAGTVNLYVYYTVFLVFKRLNWKPQYFFIFHHVKRVCPQVIALSFSVSRFSGEAQRNPLSSFFSFLAALFFLRLLLYGARFTFWHGSRVWKDFQHPPLLEFQDNLVGMFLSLCHECCFSLAARKKGWVNLRRVYVSLFELLFQGWSSSSKVSVGVCMDSCFSLCPAHPRPAGTCSWTWTTLPPDFLYV